MIESNTEKHNTKRGVFLWVMLIYLIFANVGSLLSALFPSASSFIYAGGPSWDYIFNLFALVTEVAGIIGIITWKRWGIYLVVVANVAEAFVDFRYFTPGPPIALELSNFVLLLFIIWAVGRKWAN